MYEILVTIGSIIVLTLLGRVVKPLISFNFCAVCFGVGLTWIWLSAGIAFGYLPFDNYHLVVAVLLGGTSVGLAYQGEYRFKISSKYPLTWKVSVITAGFFLASWYLRNLGPKSWMAITALMLILMYLYFVRKPSSTENPAVSYLEEKLKRCC